MCMKIEINEVIKINQRYGGSLMNISTLDFEIDLANREKNIYKSNAHIVRGIILGHPFSDGNKRTTVELIARRFAKFNIKCNEEQMVKGLVSIAKENIHEINKIEARLRKWTKKI